MTDFLQYRDFLARLFPGIKVQKISVNSGLSCPNRDGTISTGGCIYCDNSSFSPGYCMKSDSVTRQIEEGKKFFASKYPEMKFLPYFQSFTNTLAPIPRLLSLYGEALSQPDCVGIIIGTRPDCMPPQLIKELAEINRSKPVIVEFGVESVHDATLSLINRGHTWQQAKDAILDVAGAGIPVGVHIIAGLPGETDEMILQTVREVCSLPIDTIKIHQMQVIRDTRLHRLWREGKLNPRIFTVEEYVALCRKMIEIIPRHIAIERFVSQAPPEMLVAPKWGLKNYQFMNLLNSKSL